MKTPSVLARRTWFDFTKVSVWSALITTNLGPLQAVELIQIAVAVQSSSIRILRGDVVVDLFITISVLVQWIVALGVAFFQELEKDSENERDERDDRGCHRFRFLNHQDTKAPRFAEKCFSLAALVCLVSWWFIG